MGITGLRDDNRCHALGQARNTLICDETGCRVWVNLCRHFGVTFNKAKVTWSGPVRRRYASDFGIIAGGAIDIRAVQKGPQCLRTLKVEKPLIDWHQPPNTRLLLGWLRWKFLTDNGNGRCARI